MEKIRNELGIVVNGEMLAWSPCNTSKTKQHFSFNLDRRFRVKKEFGPERFYNIPSSLSRRGTSIGYGDRFKMGDNSPGRACPSPDSYTLKSDFDFT